MERSIFGGAGPGDDGAGASPVLLRIPRQPSLVLPAGPHVFVPRRPPEGDRRAQREHREHPNRWILYLMGQGLANLATFEILRPYVPPGQEFEVKVGFRHARDSSVGERAAIEGLAVASLGWPAPTVGSAPGPGGASAASGSPARRGRERTPGCRSQSRGTTRRHCSPPASAITSASG